MDNQLLLWGILGLAVLYFYLKSNERKQPTPLNTYDREIHEILNKEEYKVKGKFD